MGAGRPCEPHGDMPKCARACTRNAIQLARMPCAQWATRISTDSAYMTIDHTCVQHFHPASPRAIGVLQEVTYLNDHLLLGLPHASTMARCWRIKLLGNIH